MRISPLRYPGGKGKMYEEIKNILISNKLEGCIFYDVFTGGAEIPLQLLENKIVSKVILNEKDISIHSIWWSILYKTQEFITFIEETKVNLLERKKHKKNYNLLMKEKWLDNDDLLKLACSTFYLNRVNRSGIIKGGPISSTENTAYPLSCRFNKQNLIKKIDRIVALKNNIILKNECAINVLEHFSTLNSWITPTIAPTHKHFIFIDPPYYNKGKTIYNMFFQEQDHVLLRDVISYLNEQSTNFLITYDNVEFIKELYKSFNCQVHELSYTMANKTRTKELMIFSDTMEVNNEDK